MLKPESFLGLYPLDPTRDCSRYALDGRHFNILPPGATSTSYATAQMALRMLAHFNTWCIKMLEKTKSGPDKNEGPQLFNIRGPSGRWNFYLISTPVQAGHPCLIYLLISCKRALGMVFVVLHSSFIEILLYLCPYILELSPRGNRPVQVFCHPLR